MLAKTQQCGMRNRKPVGKISDRAKRYRANTPECKPAGPKKCALCGSRSFLVVDHVDGDESNGSRSNLRYLCKSCNTREGKAAAAAGAGVRTRQYNPLLGDMLALRAFDYAERHLGERLGNPDPVAVLQGALEGDQNAALAELLARNLEHAGGGELLENPGPTYGGHSFGQVSAALASVSPEKKTAFAPQMDLDDARAIVRDVQAAGDMSRFQREVWRIRRQRHGSSGRAGGADWDVPF